MAFKDFQFYRGRVLSCPSYGLTAGHELLRLTLRCAMSDPQLTGSEFNSIMKLANEAHIKMMEDNFNERFQQNP